MKREIKKILIANRGEIALRIMRSAREMGISCVAVYSEADQHAPFVKYADEAYCIGPPPSTESYLRGDKIIEVAFKSGAQAIHPGYGFLSEKASFARMVRDAGLIFIGPSPESMEMMGDKLNAKATAARSKVPMIEGSDGAVKDYNEALRIARKIGFPLLIKASAGGGGKGMRLVEKEDDLEMQMKMAMSEALSAFGDGSVFIEKFAEKPRHVEIQIIGDEYGNIVHLFERECSIQRRHQKLIEEAPSCVLTPELRERMGKCAVEVARACGYYSAGTVEFLVDKNLNFYFLEMNTRLQVEHPVTEFITGVDLVKEQILVAMGLPLSFRQEDLSVRGHAIEVRVCAEDPSDNFLPDTGTLYYYQRPSGPGVRVDDGVEQGMEIPIYYDPMIAKLIVYGRNREEAIEKMIRAIDDYEIVGVETTLDFCKFVLRHPAFIKGDFDTSFIKTHFQPELLEKNENGTIPDLAAIAAVEVLGNVSGTSSAGSSVQKNVNPSLWKLKRKGYR